VAVSKAKAGFPILKVRRAEPQPIPLLNSHSAGGRACEGGIALPRHLILRCIERHRELGVAVIVPVVVDAFVAEERPAVRQHA